MRYENQSNLIPVIYLILLLTPVTTLAQANGRIPTIDAFIQERMDSLNIPGAALAVVRERGLFICRATASLTKRATWSRGALLRSPIWMLTRDRHDNKSRDMLHFMPRTKLS